ncbi:hypothetical protein D3C76_1771960 [compost metagenome]
MFVASQKIANLFISLDTLVILLKSQIVKLVRHLRARESTYQITSTICVAVSSCRLVTFERLLISP